MRLFKKACAIALAAAIVFTSVDIPAYAAAADGNNQQTEVSTEDNSKAEAADESDDASSVDKGKDTQETDTSSDDTSGNNVNDDVTNGGEAKDNSDKAAEDKDDASKAGEDNTSKGEEDASSSVGDKSDKDADDTKDNTSDSDNKDKSDVKDNKDEQKTDDTEKKSEEDNKKEESKKAEEELTDEQKLFNKAIAENGTITLSEDMKVSKMIEAVLSDGLTEAELTIDLNGHMLYTDEAEAVMYVGENVKVNILDSTLTDEAKADNTVNAGIVNNAPNGIVIYNEGTVTLSGVAISATGANSIGVLNDSTLGEAGLIIKSGTIKAEWFAVGKTAKAAASVKRPTAFFAAAGVVIPNTSSIGQGGYTVDDGSTEIDADNSSKVEVKLGELEDKTDKEVVQQGAAPVVGCQIVNYNTVKINWSAVSEAVSYVIKRSTSINGNYEVVGSTSLLSFDNTVPETGVTYYFKVTAIDGSGIELGTSEASSATTVYDTPTGTSAKMSAYNKINVTWSGVAGAQEYTIYRSTSPDSGYTKIGNSTGTSYSDSTSIEAGINYYYKVAASKGSYVGPLSSYTNARTILNTPSNVKVSKKYYDTATLTWSAVPGATRYKVYHSTDPNGTFKYIGEAKSTGFTKNGVVPGIKNYYKVTALNSNNASQSNYSSSVNLKTSFDKKPGGLKVSSTSYNSIKLTWSKVNGATSYEVYRSTKKSSGFKKIASTKTNSYTNKKLKTNKTYYYKIKAKNKYTKSPYSSVVKGKSELAVPKNLKASSASYNSIKLTWSKAGGASKYDIYRSTKKNSGYKKIKTTSSTKYTDKKLSSGTTYYYKIKAVRGSYKSDYSDRVQCKPLPPATSKFKAESVSYNEIKLSWNKVTGATKYVIYRSTKEKSGFKKIETINNADTLTFTDSKLTTGTKYYYRIYTYVDKAKGGYKTASATPITNAPSNFVADNISSTSIKLTWDEPAGATGYIIYRSTESDKTGFTELATVQEDKYIDRNLTLGQAYYYKVQSVRNGVKGKTSGVYGIHATIPGVKNLTATGSSNEDYIKLAWEESDDATSYLIERSIDDGDFRFVGELNSNKTSYIDDDNIKSGKLYTYRVYVISDKLKSNPKIVSYSFIKSISLNKTEASLEPGKTLQLTATVTPASATDQNIAWSSSDKSVATVTSSGLVTAVANGTASITAKTVNGKTASCTITVGSGSSGLIVVLDPGHGGSDPGKVANGYNEKDLNLKIAKYAKEELEKYSGVTVYLTRTGDSYVGLEERTEIAKNYKADVFVSLHLNSADASANGAEVYVTVKDAYKASSTNLANNILSKITGLGIKNRGVKTRLSSDGVNDYYAVIRHSVERGFPGIIVENAFLTGNTDINYLNSDAKLKKLGVANATGIAYAYGLTKK